LTLAGDLLAADRLAATSWQRAPACALSVLLSEVGHDEAIQRVLNRVRSFPEMIAHGSRRLGASLTSLTVGAIVPVDAGSLTAR
jgi:hypothetical protein